MKLNRDTVADMCAKAHMVQARREQFKGYEIFIADGFSLSPEVMYQKFGVKKGEFPFGAFCTLWFVGRNEDKFDCGAPMIFDWNHNPEYDGKTKEIARVNAATLAAKEFINARQRNARILNG